MLISEFAELGPAGEVETMNEEQPLADIVQTLTGDHGCHAVILYGSRARGDFQPTSDWDVVGIRETGPTAPLRVARVPRCLARRLRLRRGGLHGDRSRPVALSARAHPGRRARLREDGHRARQRPR